MNNSRTWLLFVVVEKKNVSSAVLRRIRENFEFVRGFNWAPGRSPTKRSRGWAPKQPSDASENGQPTTPPCLPLLLDHYSNDSPGRQSIHLDGIISTNYQIRSDTVDFGMLPTTREDIPSLGRYALRPKYDLSHTLFLLLLKMKFLVMKKYTWFFPIVF